MRTILVSILLSCIVCSLSANEALQESTPPEEYKIGVMVKEIDVAIDSPRNPASLEIIAKYGTDSRYYVMIRGWLIQELSGVDSQLSATRDPAVKSTLQQKADFLRLAIRRIDLE